MKLMGPHHHIRKQQSSNSTSSPTSPPSTVCDDTDFVHNSLLYSDIADPVPEVGDSSSQVTTATSDPDSARHPKDNINDLDHAKLQQLLRCESVNSTAVHNLRLSEDDNPGYDSSSSFEFQKDRSYAQSHQLTRSFSRPMSSKWNDAEKWIINKQSVQPKKNSFLHNQVNHRTSANMGRVAPELVATSTKLVDFCQTASQVGFENSSFIAPATPSLSGQAYGGNLLIEMDQFSQCTDMKEVDQTTVSTKSLTEDRTGKVVPVIRSVCMRDMGTEMTPIASQEPSRTGTPVGATTPIRSPTTSIPSTPRAGGPAPTPTEQVVDEDGNCTTESGKKELSEEELKLKTRKEIVALGVKLGKMNIAAWASKDEEEKNMACNEKRERESLEQIELEKRAAAWEEAEKSKHTARYKREEIQIQAWESKQIAKLEAEMRRTEARVEQIRVEAEAKMVKKVAMARQRAEERRGAAESKKNRDEERTAAKAEYIRHTGRMPSNWMHNICCGWL
ncbi:Remorin 4.1 [Linum perenne]